MSSRTVTRATLAVVAVTLLQVQAEPLPAILASAPPQTAIKSLIAHRGASAYAPEHTLPAYRLAIAQGADYVEQDLAVTKDGALICLHDDSLERTTNVEEVFPDRGTVDESGRWRWLAVDFTLAEIKRLDAGSWFDARFAGERIPTWEEAVAAAGTAAGLYPELKTPALYRARQVDLTGLFVASVTRLGLAARPAGSLIVQSFDDLPLRELAVALPGVPRVLHRRPGRGALAVAGRHPRRRAIRDGDRSEQAHPGRPARGRTGRARGRPDRHAVHLHDPRTRHAFCRCERRDGVLPVRARRGRALHGQPRPFPPFRTISAMNVEDLERIAVNAARALSPALEVVGVTLGAGGGTYAEVLIKIRGCRIDPCSLSVGVFRSATEEVLHQEISERLARHVREHGDVP